MDIERSNSILSYENKINFFNYYEYKYLVSHENLPRIKMILAEFCKDSDPFPFGVVDSIYYDTYDEKFLKECINGQSDKNKFRIRGYGDGNYIQVHQKTKALSSVGKFKCKIKTLSMKREMHPLWENLESTNDPTTFQKINFNARRYGMLLPSIRVQYFRYRFRLYDYRITLDTNIEVFSPSNGLPRKQSYGCFDHHVLEIKTMELRPKLPFIGLIQLPQISFSKFMLGLGLLNT